ncbi:MAG: flippase-like domain-containing protein [Acidobacteriota bacterium]|jgi:uncharacterized protein (TIRG00374 family)|nr:flippase-like domain-containing protein [Acidobacteriota bacterium]MDQ3417543.1 flippase-like domain-containing protein [Acidobacteriota bacterium]
MNKGGLSRLLRILVAVVLTAYVIWRADPALVMRQAAGLDWRWATAAIVLVLVDRGLMAFRWMVLLCALTPGSRPPFAEILRIFFVSTFVGSFLPSVAGDVYRAYSLSRLKVDGVQSAASVVMDRALGILSMVVVAIVALAFAREMMMVPGVGATVGVSALGCAVGAAALYSTRAAAAAHRLTSWLPGKKLRYLSASLIDAVRRYTHHHRELTTVLVSSIAVQGLRVLQAFCLGMALGISAPLWVYFVFIPLIIIVMQVPITISGLGVSQWMFELLFTRVGVTSEAAVALSILFVALAFIGNLPGAVLYASGRGEAR